MISLKEKRRIWVNSTCVYCLSRICVGRKILEQSLLLRRISVSVVSSILFCSAFITRMIAYDNLWWRRFIPNHEKTSFLKCGQTKIQIFQLRHATKIVSTAASYFHKYLQPPRYRWSEINLKLFKQVKVTEYPRFSPALRWKTVWTYISIFSLS